MLNKNTLTGGSAKNSDGTHKDAYNERAQRQDEIEKRLVGQLGDRFKDAVLLEVSEGSYLIQNRVKMPIFGRSVHPLIRTKSSISKRAYLLTKTYGTDIKRYRLDSKSMVNAQGQTNTQESIPRDMNDSQTQIKQVNPMIHRTGAESFDSESDMHTNPHIVGSQETVLQGQIAQSQGRFSDNQFINMGST